MRSQTRLPVGFQFYPQFLQAASYCCTNNSKEHYTLVKPGKVWDESSKEAHWKNRAEDQPFFVVFNHTISHESQTRKRPHQAANDPSTVRILLAAQIGLKYAKTGHITMTRSPKSTPKWVLI